MDRGTSSDEPEKTSGDSTGPSIEAELERILASAAFAHAERLSRLLRFAVQQTIQGHGDQLKEYVLGIEVFDRSESFDPRLDPAVRVEAHRLRSKLKKYYEGEGRGDPVRIEFPKGSYAPVFRPREARAQGPLAGRAPRRLRPAVGLVALSAAVLLAGAAYYWIARRPPARPAPAATPAELSSIVVLPFADVSPDRDQEYFCDGITEELINALAKVEGLRVVSRTSAFQFKGKSGDVRQIGSQLSVGTALEGSVRKAGNKLRITAQLVKVADGYHLWSGTYERELKDVFAVQEEISRAIVGALRLRLVGEHARRLIAGQTDNLNAYHLYLQGRYYWNQRTEGGLKKAIEYFQQATAEERNYAAAYAGVADSHAMLASYGLVPPKEAMPKAKTAALKALSIDDTLAPAHASLGFVLSFYDWDWRGAEREYRRAIELHPGYATAHHWYSGCLRAVGRFGEAMAEIKRAEALDPLSVAVGRDLGRTLLAAGQYDQAIAQYHKVLELEPNFPSGYLHLGLAYEAKSMFPQALEALQKARSLPGGNPLITAALAHCHALSGNRREAERLLAELDAQSRRTYVAPVSIALVYAGLKDNARAFEWLDRAYEEHDPWLAWLNVDPIFAGLRADARFAALAKRIGLAR